MKNSNLSYIKAKNKVDKEKSFYSHLVIYLIVNVVITMFKVYGNLGSWDHFMDALITINVLSVWIIWGVFLILHFLSYKYGLKWEERKIEALMQKELSKKK